MINAQQTATLDPVAVPRAEAWKEARPSLAFRLGDVTLFSWSFPALALEVTFNDLMTPRAEAELPFDRLRRGAEALLVPLPSSPGDPEPAPLARTGPALRYAPASRVNYYIDLHGSFADYLAHLPGKARHEMMRKLRKFASLGGGSITMREYRRPAEVDEFQQIAHAISKKTYQSRLLKLGIPDDAQFRAELIHYAEADRLRGYILFLKEQPVAFGFCVIERDILDYVQTGYDPDLHDLSPGIVLLHALLDSAFAEQRYSALNFGIGESQWKRMYATGSMRYTFAYYFRPTLLNRLMARAHAGVTGLSDSAGRVLAAMGLKEKYKKLLRRGLGSKPAALPQQAKEQG